MSTMTREAKVRIGFDIDTAAGKKGFQENAKAAEQLEKAIDKVIDKYKLTREEFNSNKTAAISGALGTITKAAAGVSDEVGRMLGGFAVVTNVVDMFNKLNGSIQDSVKNLKEMRSIGSTLTQLQVAKMNGTPLPGVNVAGTVGKPGGSIAATATGAALGGATVSAASQFATTAVASQANTALDSAVGKLSERVAKKADSAIDNVIDATFKLKGKGSAAGALSSVSTALVPSTMAGAGGSAGLNIIDILWQLKNGGAASGSGKPGGGAGGITAPFGFMMRSPQQNDPATIGAYVHAAVQQAMPTSSPLSGIMGAGGSTVPTSGFGQWLQNSTERMRLGFGSPKNRIHFGQGGLAGGLLGAAAGFGLSGGSLEGAAAGGGLGSVVGSVGNVVSSGGMMKSMSLLASPIGAALAAAAASAAAIFLVKGGKYGDKAAESIAGWFLSFFDDAAAKAQKKLAAKQAETTRLESIDSLLIPIQNARRESVDGVRREQLELSLHQNATRNGMAGAGLDSSLDFGTQNIADANARLIQAQTARMRGDLGRGGNPSDLRSREEEASADFQSQLAAQRQLTDARAAGQMAMLDPEIAKARKESEADNQRLNWMQDRKSRIGPGKDGLKANELGFTDTAFAAQFEKAEQSTRKLVELEKQRSEIKRSTLEVQKQEFAVYREQVRAGEQAARQALAEKQGTIEAAKQDFGTMNQADRDFTLSIAKKLKSGGVESLSEDEKQFAQSNQNIFGATLKPQLSALGDKNGFSDLQALISALNSRDEEKNLKRAQELKIEVERNITAQLGISEEKLANDLANKINPLFDRIVLIIEKKTVEAIRTATDKMGRDAQAASQNAALQK